MTLLNLAHEVGKYCVGMEGNVSSRAQHLYGFCIKSSGAELSKLTENDISTYTMDGKLLSGRRGSIETDFHQLIYTKNWSKYGIADVNFIAHTHPISTLTILCSNSAYIRNFSSTRFFPEQVIWNDRCACVVDYATPGTELSYMIEKDVQYFIDKNDYFPRLILLRNHGIIACGKTAEECIRITEICEKSATLFLGLDECYTPLHYDAIDKILNHEGEKYRKTI